MPKRGSSGRHPQRPPSRGQEAVLRHASCQVFEARWARLRGGSLESNSTRFHWFFPPPGRWSMVAPGGGIERYAAL
eukprot:3977533-Prymnesium_polylepis.1